MKRSIAGVALALSLFLAPLAHADTGYVPIGDPYTDTIGLWSEIASALSSLADGFASLFDGNEFAAVSPATPRAALAAAAANAEPAQAAAITYTVRAGDTLSGIAQTFSVSLSNILAANDLSQDAILHVGENLVIPDLQTAPAISNQPTPTATPDQTTHSQDVKSANTEPSGPQTIDLSPLRCHARFQRQRLRHPVRTRSGTPRALDLAFNQVRADDRSGRPRLADGNPLIPYAAESNIVSSPTSRSRMRISAPQKSPP